MFTSIYSQIDFYEHPDSVVVKDNSLYRPIYGGDFSLMFGTYTNISVSPKIVFPIKNFAATGMGFDLMYLAYQRQSSFIYGGNIFNEFYIANTLILHSELQMLNIPDYSNITPVRAWDLGVYIGGGLKISMGSKAYMAYMLLWNLNYSYLSPYTNPTFRVSFYF